MKSSESIAHISRNRKRWKRASRMSLDELDRAVSADPRNEAAHFFRAVRLIDANRPGDALEALKLAAELAPRVIELHLAVGHAERCHGSLEGALVAFEAALEICPRHVEALCEKGEVLAEMLVMEESLRTMELAASLDRYSPVAHMGVGVAQRALGWDDGGLGALKRAAALDPRDAHARAELGLALTLQDRDGEALDELDRAIRIDGNDAYPRALKCVVLGKGGRLGEALAEIERALSVDRGSLPLRIVRALFLSECDRADEALAEADSVVHGSPGLARAQGVLGQAQGVLGHVLVVLGRNEDALEHLERAIRANPKNALAHSDKTRALQELRRAPEGGRR